MGLGDVGLGDMDTGTQGRDKQTTPDICAEFVEYIFSVVSRQLSYAGELISRISP